MQHHCQIHLINMRNRSLAFSRYLWMSDLSKHCARSTNRQVEHLLVNNVHQLNDEIWKTNLT